MVQIATKNRANYKHWLKEIKPQKVLAPFGIKQKFIDADTKIITRKENIPTIGERRTNERLHAKLILGDDFLLTGSCNFTDNSINDQHEILLRFDKSENPYVYKELENYFDELWKRSEDFNGINDTL